MSCSEWREVKLEDIIQFNSRENIVKKQIAKKIAMEKLKPFNKTIEGYEYAEFKGGTKFRNGDTLLARITPCLENGKTAQVSILNEDEVGFGSTEYIVLREKPNKSVNDFIYYLAISPRFRDIAIKSMIGTSGRQRVQQDVLENTSIPIPPLSEQKAIAATLSCLDDKIELNNRINKTLEEMAQVIFKSWFVDFEPFQDGEFEDSELGRIPKGWRVGTIGEFVKEMKNGGTPSRKNDSYWNSKDVPWIKTGEIKNSLIIESEEYISCEGLKNSSAKVLPYNSILMAMYGATAGQIGLLKFKASTNQACCAMICISANKAVFLYLYLLANQSYIESLAVGAAQQNLSKDTISKLRLIIPKDEVIETAIFDELKKF
ncbi:MAG: restriction endonuclease subunit S [Firmicutes bacterium HGW-Firmicutes-12]|nr:MAG: restriction endonuclease subunit S [Firmicutes bacterium HGW-Firmicutes-12]